MGVTQDYEQAVYWFLLAAEQGEARAQGNLAYMYHHGLGVPQNDRQARYWQRLSEQ